MEFERLAFHLLRNKFPGLSPSEQSHDGGEDAYPLLTAPGDIEFRMAASFDNSMSKVIHDAERIRGRDAEVNHLIFVTPRSVRRTDADRWKEEIRSRFGMTLELISREGIEAELERPENAWLCRQYLGLDLPEATDLDATAAKARAVINARLPELRSAHHVPPDPVELTLTEVEERSVSSESRLNVRELAGRVRGGGRILLRGAAGAGKTCTLLQLGETLANDEWSTVPVYLSGADWALDARDLKTYAGEELSLTGDEWTALHENGRLVVILNGWNEIPTAWAANAESYLRELARRWPQATLVVSTRDGNEDAPPFRPDHVLHVSELDDGQRETIIRAAGIPDSDGLLLAIRTEPELDIITRTPLFLSTAISAVHRGGAPPSSRYALLRGAIHDAETGEHRVPLRQVCSGQHRRYLEAVAELLTQRGTTRLTRDDGLAAIGRCSAELVQESLVGSAPNAAEVLRALCDHHLLSSSGLEAPTVGFHHPLFQEWFGAERLHRSVKCAMGAGQGILQREVFNSVAWEGSFELLMERCRETQETSLAVAVATSMIPFDLAFAARLAGIAGDDAWDEVHSAFESALARLQGESAPRAQRYALSVILSSGRPEFADTLWPMVESDDDQVRFKAYDRLSGADLLVLGRDWPSRLRAMPEGRRGEFAENLALRSGASATTLQVSRALEGEPSPFVRSAMLHALAFHGMDDLVVRWVEESPPELITVRHFGEMLGWMGRRLTLCILPWLRRHLHLIDNPDVRRPVLVSLALTGDQDSLATLKAELTEHPEIATERLLRALSRLDAVWIRQWTMERLASGDSVTHLGEIAFETASGEQITKMVEAALALRANRLDTGLLLACARVRPMEVASALARDWVKRMRSRKDGSEDELPDDSRVRDIEYVFRNLDLATRLLAILSLPDPTHPKEVRLYINLLGRSSRVEVEKLDATRRDTLRKVILGWNALLQSWPDDRRALRPHLAAELSSVGEPQDVDMVHDWLLADHQEYLERVAREGHRRNTVSYAHLLVQALAEFRSDRAGELLVALLADPEYFAYAAEGLAALLRPERPFDFTHRQRRTEAMDLRRTGHRRSVQATRYGSEIAAALSGYLRNRDPEKPVPPFDHQLCAGARALGQLDHLEAVPSILEIAAFPWSDSCAVDALLDLVYNGRALDSALVLPALQPLLERHLERKWFNEQEWWLIVRYLTVLLFCDDPSGGIALCTRLIERDRASYRVRDILDRMGDADFPSVTAALADMLRRQDLEPESRADVIVALGRHTSREATAALTDYIRNFEVSDNRQDWDTQRALVKSLTAGAQRDAGIRRSLVARAQLAASHVERSVLSGVFAQVEDPDVKLGACYLLDDRDKEVPYELYEVFEGAFSRKQPAGGGGAYTLVPRSCNPVRGALFTLLSDPRRRESARSILYSVEISRAEEGRPDDEPRHPAVHLLTAASEYWLLA